MTKQLLCPRDNTTLDLQVRFGIEVDICSKCRGMWLDRDELDKIIHASRGELPRKNAVADTVSDIAAVTPPFTPRADGGSDAASTVADFFDGLFS